MMDFIVTPVRGFLKMAGAPLCWLDSPCDAVLRRVIKQESGF